MKLLVLSDLHLECGGFDVLDLGQDVLVLAGDLCNSGVRSVRWAAMPEIHHGKPVLFVPGNHEYYNESMIYTVPGMEEAAIDTPVQVLNRKAVVIDGVRFLGCTLWTDFKLGIGANQYIDAAKGMAEAYLYMQDYKQILPYQSDFKFLKPQDTVDFHNTQRAWLSARLKEPFDGPTVVITHHAPHRNSLATQYANDWCSGAFINELPASFFEVPVLWIHGHTHTSFDYQVGNCRVVCNPRGYRNQFSDKLENGGFDPHFMVEV